MAHLTSVCQPVCNARNPTLKFTPSGNNLNLTTAGTPLLHVHSMHSAAHNDVLVNLESQSYQRSL